MGPDPARRSLDFRIDLPHTETFREDLTRYDVI
jgi:hypothetical protein